MSEPMTAEQILSKNNELDRLRDQLVRRLSIMQDRHALAIQELEKISKEMADLGTSPQTIRADIARFREELSVKVLQYEKDLVQLNEQLNTAEAVWSESLALMGGS